MAGLASVNFVVAAIAAAHSVAGDARAVGVAASGRTDFDASLAQIKSVLQSDSRDFEASFLKVPATCKSSHAAFDEVAVAIREISPSVRVIHAQVEEA